MQFFCGLLSYPIISLSLALMKKLICFLLLAAVSSVVFAKSSQEKVTEYLTEADELFEKFISYDAEDFRESVKTCEKLHKLLSKPPKELNQAEFRKRISDRVENSLENDDRRSAIKYIGQYTMFFPEDSLAAEYLEIEANLYGDKRDQMMMERSIAKMAEHPCFNNARGKELLESMNRQRLEIYAGESFVEELQGVWVSDTVNEKNGIPVFMFRVYDNGIVEMLNQSEVYSGRLKNLHKGADDSGNNPALRKPSISPVRFSVGSAYDEDKGLFTATFESKRFHQGDGEMAGAAYGGAQKTLANTSSALSYGTGSTAAMISTGIIGLAASGALLIWGNDLAASKMWETTINLKLSSTDKEEMAGTVEIIEKFAKTTKQDIEETKEEFNTKFYRVSAADNVLFADRDANLFPLYCYNPYVQDEIALYDYSEILANTKLKKKRGFLVPLYIVYFPAAIVSDVSTRKSQKNNSIKHNLQMMERVRVNNLQRRNDYLKYNLGY